MTRADTALSPGALARLLGQPEPTAEQARVIAAPLSPAVVIAGAGSGKTETMAARVVWLIATRQVQPGAVLGLTFTRKAAGELSARIRRRLAQWRAVAARQGMDTEQLAELVAGEPTVLTYAAYAGRLVAEHALRVGVEPDVRLLTEAARWQLADAVVRAHDSELPAGIGALSSVTGYVQQLAGALADHLVGPEEVAAFCADHLAIWDGLAGTGGAAWATTTRHRAALMPLVRAFLDGQRSRGAADFGAVTQTAALVAQVAEVAVIEQARYEVVLLDEYQDTGHAQVQVLAGLFGGGHPVTAVGDPFQSIYGWRGASAGNIGRFPSTFPAHDGPAPVYPLATSWRNDVAILDVANAVAAPLRVGTSAPELRPRQQAGPGSVLVRLTETTVDEARWVAETIAQRWRSEPPGVRTAAVLVRRRSQIPLLADAVRAAGLPVEIVGLGGLLTTPEVADVVATLRVLVDSQANTSAARLLTGARWRIGPADLAALGRRAGQLAGGQDENGEREQGSLVEALDDPGRVGYSPAGRERIVRLGRELHLLRRRAGAPLPELIAEIERVTGVDVEVEARRDHEVVGRVHLDRFLDEAARFASDSDQSGLRAFVAFLKAAEDEENGLDAGEVVVSTERVQILTVHGAKGLEWDTVAVPGLVKDTFPAQAKSVDWATSRQLLPAPLRGDRHDLPALAVHEAADRKALGALVTEHGEQVRARQVEEERRLAYVAFTRARHLLLLSGAIWDTGVKPRPPSVFLDDARARAQVLDWFVPAPDARNPLLNAPRTASWPVDPLGSHRAALEDAASQVEAALARPDAPAPAVQLAIGVDPVSERLGDWHLLVDALLREQAALRTGSATDVVLPDRLSVSQLVLLQKDPDDLARLLRRPVPARPAPLARRGTRFHAWLEQRWQQQTLLDVDELPGAMDEGAQDADLAALQAAFEAGEWAARTPAEIEVPFEMVVGGRVLRGRMDAVFGDDEQGWTVLDWKTGAQPSGSAARDAAVQLAAYRLAWADLSGAALTRIAAAFYYVRTGHTVRPADLLDADGLRRLVTGELVTGELVTGERVTGELVTGERVTGDRVTGDTVGR